MSNETPHIADKAALTEAERATVLATVQNWCADDADDAEVIETVERILAARLAHTPRVEIVDRIDRPSTCRVWLHDALMFDGLSKQADRG